MVAFLLRRQLLVIVVLCFDYYSYFCFELLENFSFIFGMRKQIVEHFFLVIVFVFVSFLWGRPHT